MVDFYLECATLVQSNRIRPCLALKHLKLEEIRWSFFGTETFSTFQETSNKIEVLVGHSMQLKNDILFQDFNDSTLC